MSSSSPSLKTLAFNGAIWTFVGYGTSQSLRFVSNLILTRLLAPEYFGLMALVNTFIVGLELFSDVGIGPSVIQNKRGDDPLFLNTAWTVQVIRSWILWGCCLLIAFPAAYFYQEPRLVWLLPIVGLTTVINGLSSTAGFTLRRHISLDKVTKFEASVQVVALTLMNVWAWLSPSIWALVGGNLMAACLKTVRSHFLIPNYRNWFAWDREALKDLFTFGRWIMLSTIMSFLAMQTDRLMLGKLVSIQMLGVYTIAFTLSDMPRQVIAIMGNTVIFPLVSKKADLPRSELRHLILEKRWLLLVGAAFMIALLVGFGDLVTLALYDQRYQDAGWMVTILTAGLWHTLLYSTMSPCLLGVGRPGYATCGNALRFGILVLGLPLGYHWLGLPGVVLTAALSDLPMYGAVVWGLCREKLSSVYQDVLATLVFLGFLGLVLALRYVLGYGLPLVNTLV